MDLTRFVHMCLNALHFLIPDVFTLVDSKTFVTFRVAKLRFGRVSSFDPVRIPIDCTFNRLSDLVKINHEHINTEGT